MIRLLIVDDNEQNLYLLQFLLKGHGYEVTTAANGSEALEIARHDPPDIIITDILMPVMDGFTLCREWKRDERLKEVPFIFYTATYTEPSDEKLALSLGAERFLVKPVKPEVFVEMLQEVIEEQEAGLAAPRQPEEEKQEQEEEEEAYLEEYNKALIRKLEDKRAAIEQFRDYAKPETNSIVDVPFLSGTIAINSEEEDAFDEADIHILSQFAQVMSEGYRRLVDITKRKQMEQELIRMERLRSLNEMAAGVSHNLNNMLVSVLGPALLLQRATKDSQVLREVEEIITGTKRARDLVQRLNQAVRGEQEGELYPVSVNEVIQQVVHSTQPRWKDQSEAKGITVEVVTELEDVPSIPGNQSELNDILLNLLFNAVDAMLEGGKITFRTQTIEEGVQLTVTDTGKGMNEETRRKVFEPFFTTKMDIGTGLGLTTVHGTMARWGGSIDVESTPGHGTTFTLRFPVWTGQEAQREEKSAEERQGRSGKLLIVEDDEATCGLLDRLLSETHEVESVLDGRKALEQFEPDQYDVVLIDLGMPGLPGDRVAREMKQVDPLVATVLITGWDLKPDDPRLVVFDLRIEKPFDDLDEIEDVVARAIELHDQRTGEGK